jgi:hypothetical protein
VFSFFVQTRKFSGGRSQTLGGRDRTPLVRFGSITGSGTCRGVVSADPVKIEADKAKAILRKAKVVASDETGVRIEGTNSYH